MVNLEKYTLENMDRKHFIYKISIIIYNQSHLL